MKCDMMIRRQRQLQLQQQQQQQWYERQCQFSPIGWLLLPVVILLILVIGNVRHVDSANVAMVEVDSSVDVREDGSVITNDMVDNDTDDPWDFISKFIQSNILVGTGSTNNNDDHDDDGNQVTGIGTGSSDRSRKSSSNSPLFPNENIWNSFRLFPTDDVIVQDGGGGDDDDGGGDDDDDDGTMSDPTIDATTSDTTKPQTSTQQQHRNDVIQEGWNQFLQNIVAVPNPFIKSSQEDSHNNKDNGDKSYTEHDQYRHHNQYDALKDLIESVSAVGHHQFHSNKKQLSIPDMIDLFWTTIQSVRQQLEGTFKCVLDLILPIVNPLQAYYFMLEQEIVHNPVYKRRQHAYYTELSVHTAIQISEGLYVSQLAYANDCKTIQKYLKSFQNNSWVLINCTTTAQPFQPAHFLAIRHSTTESNATWTYPIDSSSRNLNDASSTSWTTMLWENIRDALNLTNTDGTKNSNSMELEAMLVVSGTKDLADMMSDALLEPIQYNNSTHEGFAHSGIYSSALFIHNTYRDFLENLIKKTNRTKLKLWLIGHSLGGGTAALACLEFNKPYSQFTKNVSSAGSTANVTSVGNLFGDVNMNNYQRNALPSIDAYALGFGTPAVLSKEFSEDARAKVTTIINDADCVPRMSGATLVNFLLNVTASNHWITEAQVDILHLKQIMKEKSPFPEIWVDTVMSTIYDWISKSDEVNDTMKAKLAEEVREPVLFPPGECIHIYRDGTAWQGVYYPCQKFHAVEGVRYMVDDHLIPTGYYRGLLGYVRLLKNDMNWQFRPDLTDIPIF